MVSDKRTLKGSYNLAESSSFMESLLAFSSVCHGLHLRPFQKNAVQGLGLSVEEYDLETDFGQEHSCRELFESGDNLPGTFGQRSSATYKR